MWDNAYEADAIDLAEYKARLGEIREHQRRLLERKAELEKRITSVRVDEEQALALEDYIRRV